MLARVSSTAVLGIDAYLVDVEVDISSGLPTFTTVGLPEAAVKESKERVKAAINNSGFRFPAERITVNLAPADVRKEGTGFDLPIALGILTAKGMMTPEAVAGHLFLGELSLDGRIKPIRGTLPMALTARRCGYKAVVLPHANRGEAAAVDGVTIVPARTLAEVVAFFRGEGHLETRRAEGACFLSGQVPADIDFAEVMGQEHAKRALEIAAAGGHNLLMIGPPGAGKTMLAKRLPTVLPPLSFEEALETTKILSVVGMVPEGVALVNRRPFRAPHHTISDAGLVGGGNVPRPGEVSLAHNGVLFLDELPEFKKHVLEVLRQPLEDRRVTIARAASTISYPASFMLVAAMNPCPCGYFTDPQRECSCTPYQIQRYRSRISGPLLDRIDIQVEVPSLPFKQMQGDGATVDSAAMRTRVTEARRMQAGRFKRTGVFCNARMNSRQLRRYCRLDKACNALLETAVDKLGVSARAYSRIVKIARTIADLGRCDAIQAAHIAEAIQYRSLDRSRH